MVEQSEYDRAVCAELDKMLPGIYCCLAFPIDEIESPGWLDRLEATLCRVRREKEQDRKSG